MLEEHRELWEAMFYPGSQEDNQLAWAFYLLDQQGSVEQMPLSQLRRRVMMLMLNADQDSMPDIGSTGELLEFLRQYPCSERTQWVRAQVWQDPMSFYRNYRHMVELARPIVERHSPEIQPVMDRNLAYAREQFAEQGKLAWERYYLMELVDDPDTTELHIVPLALYFFNSGYCRDHTISNMPVYMFVGMFEKYLRELEDANRTNTERFARQWRTVAESRRMDILKLLKESPRYGRELAELLELTPAAVSQHMSSLVRDDFVIAEKHGSRISYSLNREKVQTFLADLKNVLL